jgi:hypothetical protein
MSHANLPGSEQADDRHADDVAELIRTVLRAPAVTVPATRAAAYHNNKLPPPLGEYAAKVQAESYRVTDDDIQALVAAGYAPDAVFEITVAAALGAAMQRLEASLGVLGEAR